MIEKDKKEIKSYMKKLSDDFGKQVGVYMEQAEDRFKAAGEGMEGINERLDKMQGDIDNITLELRETKLKVQDISFDVNITLDKKVDKKLFLDLDSRVGKLEKNK